MPYAALHAKAALDDLKLAAKSAPAIMVGITIATTAMANLPAMGDAKANWNSLAKALEVEYPGLIGNAVFLSRAGWIADDREEFLNAASVFGGDLQKLSGLCYNMESQVDQVRDAYAVYWMQIGVLAAAVLGYIVACQAMKATPYMRAAGDVLLQRLSALTNSMIAQKTKVLYGFLAVAGGTLATSSQSMGQLFNVQPTQGAAIDFERAVIHTTPPSQYLAPKRELPAPPEKKGP
ncbi:hypothetical protein MF672_002055 [Actinomadura sp. ATCC 31491]|uniref:PPE domain-containing protein n=1 Tax=Actinomadura luzonensis TaxID=2805427 RepID=A0ABT0FJV3_9ACTN|nr:hypothetical protein [Actinomadura luzonensis]MCK2212589.1 hypothetical protein [Actinomadura luzonensis]